MTETDLSQIINFAQDLGVWIIFAWLYVQEKRAHQDTRNQYRDDLREIAGIRKNIGRVQTFVADAKQVPKTSEMIDL